jgi:hypothetical protein
MEESKQNTNDALTNNGALTESEIVKKYLKEELDLNFDTVIIYDEPKKQVVAKTTEADNVSKIDMLEKENERLTKLLNEWVAKDAYLRGENQRLTELDKYLSKAKSQLKAEYGLLLTEREEFNKEQAPFNINIRSQLSKVSRYVHAAIAENSLKIRIGYNKKSLKALLPALDQNKSGMISLRKGPDRKEFKISVYEHLNNSEYGWLSDEESLIYPLSFTLSAGSHTYEAISLTTDFFNEALGDSFLRYGTYFINGLGVFSVSITASGTYLIYQRGAKRKDTENYEYYIPLIGQKSASVLKLSQIFNELAELKPEQERLCVAKI